VGAIFVSYRRSDSQGEAGRLFDDLVKHFGEYMVFMDVAGIEAGRDFRKAIAPPTTLRTYLRSSDGAHPIQH
jgi:hypothetical protein